MSERISPVTEAAPRAFDGWPEVVNRPLQFAQIERLLDEGVWPGQVLSDLRAVLGQVSRDQNHRTIWIEFLDFVQELNAIPHRHVDVRNDEIRTTVPEHGNSLHAIVSDEGLE